MKYFFRKIKKHLGTLAQIVIVFGAAALVLLYFLGYYDFSFLDRYAIFSDSPEGSQKPPFVSVEIDPAGKGENPPESDETDENSGTSSDETDSTPEASEKPKADNTATALRAEDLANYFPKIITAEQAERDGLIAAPTDGSYLYQNGRSALAKLTFDFKLPYAFSNRMRTVVKEVVVTPGENGESTDHLISDEKYVVNEEVKEQRPAVELYMGYILLDNGKEFFLLDSSGKPLFRYDADRYIPAYTRDSTGRPLFMRIDWNKVHYFHVAEDGSGFIHNDYNPDTDSRGLNFDYPLLWGTTDNTTLGIVSETYADIDAMTEEYGEEYMDSLKAGEQAAVDALAGMKIPIKYLYGYVVHGWYSDEALTEVKFTSARVFREGRAAVTTDEDRGSLYFINRYGYKMFANAKTYVNEHNRYVTEYVMPPLTKGIESLGHYYYENGIVRIRKQTIDYYNFDVRDTTRVVKDYDCLVRLDGSEISLPAGYTLKGYSEGMAVLEKNGRYGIYDITGRWIAQPIYADAKPSMSGLCVLTLPDRRSGMIDREGNIVLPFTYSFISSVSSGRIAAYRLGSGWSVYTIMDDPDYTEPAE